MLRGDPGVPFHPLAALAAASACSNLTISSFVAISPSSFAAIAFEGGDGGGERASSAWNATTWSATWSATASGLGETRLLNNLILPCAPGRHVRMVDEEHADGASSGDKLAGSSLILYRDEGLL